MDSGFHALDSGFSVSEIWIPDSYRKRDSGFWIPKSSIPDSISKNFPRFPECGFPYMGREQVTLIGTKGEGGTHGKSG